MTVIEFGKKDLKINNLIVVLLVVIVFSSVVGVVLYGRLIGLRHDVSNSEKILSRLQVQNAELENQLNNILNSANTPSFVQSTGLVMEQHPRYAAPLQVISQAVGAVR